MATFLAEEWLDLQSTTAADLPAESGVSATIQYIVNGAPDGNVTYTIRVEDGRVVEAALGKDVAGDLTFTISYEGAQRLARGDLETGAAFMQGGLKVEGDMAKLIPLLELMHRADYRDYVARIADQTQF
jgi:putative sterol carrier protein